MSHPVLLSVDDDPLYHDLYRNIFEPKGYVFISALDAAEGLDAAIKNKPDIILLDIMMPESKGFSDGYGMLEELKRMPACKDIPVLMVSALGDPADAKHGIELGADDYLAKHELTPTILFQKVEKLLGKEK